MIPFQSLRVGDILRRPKGFLAEHVGLYAGDGYVFENDPQQGEGLVSYNQIYRGQIVQVERTVPPAEVVVKRLRERLATARPYALFTNNCEQSVFGVVHGTPFSPQLDAAISGIVVGIVAILLLR